MLLVEVNISKIAFFIAAQNFSQVVTKLVFKNLDKVALNIQERCKILTNLFDKKDP